jgi:diguanylate cyclase (GGDEF)-like protein
MMALAARFPQTLALSRQGACAYLHALFAETTAAGIAVVLINLDNFKKINEALGYAAADQLLETLHKRVLSVADQGMSVHRLGGGEFLLAMPGVIEPRRIREVVELIEEMLRFPIDLEAGRRSLSGSLGISLFPDDGSNGAEILRNAEIAMYEAKDRGRNRHCFFRRTHYDIIQQRLSLEHDLVEALADDQLLLYYEPRVDLNTERFCGMEALVRWKHPQRGLVPPLEFIYLAEQTGLINRLGQIVFEKAVRQAARWREAGIPAVPISVNLSAFQLNDRDLLPFMQETLARYGVPVRMIDIELTESAAVSTDDSAAGTQLQQLRAMGFRLMIDDFGTGFSSLGQLQQLRPDILKVDKSFTATLDSSADGKVFVAAIISMAHALSMRVIAEGVETVEQVRHLRDLRCDEIQGYLLSRPMPSDAMTALQQQPAFPQIY